MYACVRHMNLIVNLPGFRVEVGNRVADDIFDHLQTAVRHVLYSRANTSVTSVSIEPQLVAAICIPLPAKRVKNIVILIQFKLNLSKESNLDQKKCKTIF